ncbi:DUF418 domain-containing protein [Gilvimarinus sp. SDUM040013]|uniref:DUF418 domain-containing protein n=1 Tax=Gilvimarinus gilvus TaxID=3058038 RepID=A0ABU4RZ83_9GAMM|nr:DUF418 domain-containing protein [Gilvimarinus sp. SDUM040013]MDO3385630.1 DUF418 domain-containing protein [Gilvimarinus sp. SDUM040013]MDX6849964.1 DUF418 domain-containing protein [Gilvimarinus sp. SDUM040013]
MSETSMSESLSSPLKRISALDALRGFALLGIIVMHMLQQFGYRLPPSTEAVLHFPQLDAAVQWIGSNIVMGRFINIFAFLFGMSLFIQIDKAAQKGIDFRGRFVWRMLLLMFFGLFCHSFYSVEIISVYALFGILLLALYRVKSWVLLVLCAALIVGAPRIAQVYHHNQQLPDQPTLIEQEGTTEPKVTREQPEHIANPSFINSAKHNYAERLEGKLNYQFGFIGRGYVTFALFILGLLVGRSRFLERAHQHPKQLLLMFAGFAAATAAISVLQALMPEQNTRVFFRAEGVYLSGWLVLAKTLSDISLITFSGALVSGFLALYYSERFNQYLELLAPYGRTALTNYIMQGVIGCILFAPWALGYTFGRWGAFGLVTLGLLIYIVQGVFSYVWLKHYLYGPLEWLWRSGTYLSLQPFSRKTLNR